MRPKLTGIMTALLAVVGSTSVAWAAERAGTGSEQTFFWVTVLTGGFAMALASPALEPRQPWPMRGRFLLPWTGWPGNRTPRDESKPL